MEEPYLEECLYTPDFYIPKYKLAIEIHGKNKFYPYSSNFNNFANSKNRTYKAKGYNVMNINTWVLEGMMKYDTSNKRIQESLDFNIKKAEAALQGGQKVEAPAK